MPEAEPPPPDVKCVPETGKQDEVVVSFSWYKVVLNILGKGVGNNERETSGCFHINLDIVGAHFDLAP